MENWGPARFVLRATSGGRLTVVWQRIEFVVGQILEIGVLRVMVPKAVHQ